MVGDLGLLHDELIAMFVQVVANSKEYEGQWQEEEDHRHREDDAPCEHDSTQNEEYEG